MPLRAEIGAVGAKLLYPDDLTQHNGILTGGGYHHRVAGHAFYKAHKDDHCYYAQSILVHAVSAVTAACMVVTHQKFLEVGGFNEDLVVGYNDVDFCLKLREKGYRNVQTPFALLYHYESASRGSDKTVENMSRLDKEAVYMRERWGESLDHDPYYDPNLDVRGLQLQD